MTSDAWTRFEPFRAGVGFGVAAIACVGLARTSALAAGSDTPDGSVDGFATHAGGYQAMLREFVPDQCFLDPPCSGVDEGEPCDELNDDTTNGGCNSTPEVFGSIAIDGPPVCGVTWAAGGQQDTDWYAFSVTAVSWLTIEIRGETDVVASLSMMSAGGACPAAWVQTGTPAFSGDCD
ncbi:MAG: hypothetical protein GY715_21000, partial [Planctomycetes bacterium]|nr:hypothetical protein [Planctomycetota bacterium]